MALNDPYALEDPNAGYVWPPPHWPDVQNIGAPVPTPSEFPAPILPVPISPDEISASEDLARLNEHPPELGELPPEYVGRGLLPPELQPAAETPPSELPSGETRFLPSFLQGAPTPVPPPFIPLTPLTPEQQIVAEATRHAAEPDEAYIARQVLAEQAKKADYSAGMLETANIREKAARDEHNQAVAAQQQAQRDRARIDADAAHIAEIDPDRWMKSRSTLESLASLASVIIGGLASSATGRPNIGIEMLNKSIDDDVAAQRINVTNQHQELVRRGASVNEQLQNTMEALRAEETYQQAVYDHAIIKLQTTQQDYDHNGTTANQIETQIRNVRYEKQKAAVAGEAARTKADLDGRKAEAEIAKLNAETAKLRGGTGPGAVKPDDIIQDPSYFKTRYGVAPPVPLSEKQFAHWATTGKVVEEYSKAQRENSPAERNRELAVGEVVDDRGDPVRFRDIGFAGKLADTKAAVDQSVGLIDQLIRLRNVHGWSSDLVRSPEWRQAQSSFASLLLTAKNADQLGVLSGSDVELEGKKLGTADPTEVRDPIPGLLNARDIMIKDLNAKIRAQAVLPQDRKVKEWIPPNLHTLSIVETPLDKARTHLSSDITKLPWDSLDPEDRAYLIYIHGAPGAIGGESAKTRPRGLPVDATPAMLPILAAADIGIPPSKLRILNGFQAQAASNDEKERAIGLAELQEMATSGPTAAIKKYAAKALETVSENVISKIGAGAGSSPPEQRTSRVEAPPPPKPKGKR